MATDVKPNAFARFGNDLHSGARSYPFVGKRRLWLLLAAVLMAVSVLIPAVGGGFNLGIDFRGGSEFVVSKTAHVDTATGERIIHEKAKDASDVRVTNIAPGTIRAQMSKLSDDETLQVKAALQEGYGVSENDVTSSFVGPTWGADVTRQAFWGLVAFVVLALIGMAFYFRTWKMSLASIAGLFFTVVVTVGLYAAFGFEITPSAIIGFLTILSYSLYDSVVVFDKIRENTEDVLERRDTTFAEQINLAVNQTLVRSINTAIVGVLPVGAILFIGAFILGAGTLQDCPCRCLWVFWWACSVRCSCLRRCMLRCVWVRLRFVSTPRRWRAAASRTLRMLTRPRATLRRSPPRLRRLRNLLTR